MNIVIINNNPKGKGTFWRCFGFAKYLVKAGHSVTLLCLQDRKRFKISTKTKDGVEIILLPCNFNWGLKELPGHLVRVCIVIFTVLRRKYDIVHIFNVAFPTCGLSVFFLWIFKKIGLKRFQLVVDWDDLWGKGGLTDWKNMGYLVINAANLLETKIPLLADKVTVVSDELRQRAINAGVETQKIFKIINGADVEKIQLINKVRAREKLGLPKKGKILCYAAASVTMNYKFILTAFERIVEEFGDVKLILLSPLKDWEKEIVLKSKVGKKILILRFQTYDNYLLYLAAADVLLMPRSSHVLDRCEFPGRLGDFLASGRPIVINRAGDAWKIIEKSQSGLVANVDDSNDFSQKVVRILNDRKLINRLSENARKAAEGKYSWEEITEELIQNVYEAN